MEQYLAVASVLVLRDGKVLMVQEGKDVAAGSWNLPAGKIERDESPREAARRECTEETGARPTLDGLVGVYLDEADTTDGRVINFTFHASLGGQTPEVPEEDSITAVQWQPLPEIGALDLRAAYIQQAVNDLTMRGSLEDGRITDLTQG